MKKLNYAQAASLYGSTVTSTAGEIPVLLAVATTHGASMTAQVRARRIYEKLETELKVFYKQRDATLDKYALMFQRSGEVVEIVDNPDGVLADGIEGDLPARRAAAERALLEEETEPVPTIPLSALEAREPAKSLIERPEIVAILYPIIDDDL